MEEFIQIVRENEVLALVVLIVAALVAMMSHRPQYDATVSCGKTSGQSVVYYVVLAVAVASGLALGAALVLDAHVWLQAQASQMRLPAIPQ
ncbi:MAG: hypothetical protein PHT12_05455 [Patescibacteria group bacterium]|nr:hypothetical protein [Patescibacteria group bacterium]